MTVIGTAGLLAVLVAVMAGTARAAVRNVAVIQGEDMNLPSDKGLVVDDTGASGRPDPPGTRDLPGENGAGSKGAAAAGYRTASVGGSRPVIRLYTSSQEE